MRPVLLHHYFWKVPPMLRRLRVLAALALAPLVVFANPTTAHAAAGPWSTFNFELWGTIAPGEIKCTFSLRQSGAGLATLDVGANGVCYGAPDTTPGWTQEGEAGHFYQIWAEGTDPIGETCSGSDAGELGQHSANGTMRVAGSIPAGQVTLGLPDCSISEVCLKLGDVEECMSANIPALVEDLGGSCMYGTPTFSLSGDPVVLHSEGSSTYRWRMEGNLTINAEAPPGRKWTVAMYTQNPSTGVWSVTSTLNNIVVDRFTATSPLIRLPDERALTKTTPEPTPWPFALEISTYIAVAGTDWNTIGTGGAPDQYARGMAAAPNLPPTAPNQNYGGLTNPPLCRFWLGPKIHDIAGSEQDEPSSQIGDDGITDPEPEPDPVPEPDPEEPTDDVGWLGLIWAVLKAILSAIGALANAIADAITGALGALVDQILDGLEALFVPSEGFMDDAFEDLAASWEETTPWKYMDAVQGLVPGSASGCEGLPLNVNLPGGVAVNENIGAACSGGMASAAGIVRAVLSAVVVVGGAMACVRAVGSGFGWSPGVGRGGDS